MATELSYDEMLKEDLADLQRCIEFVRKLPWMSDEDFVSAVRSGEMDNPTWSDYAVWNKVVNQEIRLRSLLKVNAIG